MGYKFQNLKLFGQDLNFIDCLVTQDFFDLCEATCDHAALTTRSATSKKDIKLSSTMYKFKPHLRCVPNSLIYHSNIRSSGACFTMELWLMGWASFYWSKRHSKLIISRLQGFNQSLEGRYVCLGKTYVACCRFYETEDKYNWRRFLATVRAHRI